MRSPESRSLLMDVSGLMLNNSRICRDDWKSPSAQTGLGLPPPGRVGLRGFATRRSPPSLDPPLQPLRGQNK